MDMRKLYWNLRPLASPTNRHKMMFSRLLNTETEKWGVDSVFQIVSLSNVNLVGIFIVHFEYFRWTDFRPLLLKDFIRDININITM